MQNPNEDTQWNDILREKGIIPPRKEVEITEDDIIDILDETIAEKTGGKNMDDLNLDELDEIEDDFLEDERVIQEYKMKRMAEMKAAAKNDIYGELVEISQTQFVREVSEASKNKWVVCFLYKNGIPACKLMENHLKVLAAKYKYVKFVSIIGDHCIPNYPDRNLPTLLIYGKGDLQRQQVGLLGLGGMSMRVSDVESLLWHVGAITKILENAKEDDEGHAKSSVRQAEDPESDYDY